MRHSVLLSFWILCSIIGLSHPLAIHDDEEIPIDGYGPEIYIDHPLDNEDVELLDRVPLEEPANIRIRRMAKYKILESPGLHSHFRPPHRRVQDEDELKINPHRRRVRRSTRGLSELHSDEVEDVDNGSSKQNEGSDFSIESVPLAQKQTMNPAYYRSDNTDRLADKWVKAPYGDYQSRSYKEEEDSQGESSSNVGVKNRTPRVNFITQQGQQSSLKDDINDGPEARERERERERERDRDRDRERDRDQQNNKNDKNNDNSDDRYKKPLNDPYERQPNTYNKPYDPYERPHYPYERERPINPYERPSNTYNPYYRDQYGYNPYFEKYDPYYDRRYYPNSIVPPDGLSRMAPPNGMSSSFYYRHQYNDFDDYMPRTVPNYYYSDKRFELPMEPRQPYDMNRPYLYSNDVNNKPGRIVYCE